MLFLLTMRKTAGGVKRLQKVGDQSLKKQCLAQKLEQKNVCPDEVLQGKVQFSEKFAYFLPLSE